jgi:hypothetical protein
MKLQAHPGISEHERKKLCRMMDCQRLSLEACMHAAENERLPLRIVIQVRIVMGFFFSHFRTSLWKFCLQFCWIMFSGCSVIRSNFFGVL